MKTTREAAREESHDKLVSNLNELLIKNYDADKGFKNAIKNAESGSLKRFFRQQAVMRNRFSTEIEKELHELNAHSKLKDDHETGTLHRLWIDLKTALSHNDDESVLEECIRGEKASMKEYEEKLKKHHFPPHIHTMLTNQLNEIKSTIETVKKLEDIGDK